VKILVVDDDPAILRMCLIVLRGEGHECVACDSGAPALQAALREHFDLALCDLGLPDIHGLEVVRAIKLQNPGLPVIVMSALDPREWGDAAVQAGASHYLPKPLRLDALRHEVELVQSGRADLDVVFADADPLLGRRLFLALQAAGCRVQQLPNGRAIASHINSRQHADIVIVDADLDDVGPAVEACGERGVACFVAAGKGVDDDPLLRAGAAMIIGKPIDVDAVLLQARFLVTR
jgi:DNA-binding response OmpR family regulator